MRGTGGRCVDGERSFISLVGNLDSVCWKVLGNRIVCAPLISLPLSHDDWAESLRGASFTPL